MGSIDLWCSFSASGNLFFSGSIPCLLLYRISTLKRAIHLFTGRASFWISVLNLVTDVSQC